MTIFRRGTDYVEAFRWTFDADLRWFSDAIEAGTAIASGSGQSLKLTLTGNGTEHTARRGDWIIRSLDGSISTCGHERFLTRYVKA